MFPNELVQNGDGVQILRDHLVALRIQAVAPDQAVVPDDELIGKPILDHVIVIVHIVVGDNEGLFALRDVKGVPHHHRLAIGVGAFAPDVVDIHQHIVVVVDALEDLVVLIHRHHPVVNAVGLRVAVKSQLRIGHDGMEEQMLHNAVPRHIGHAVHRSPVNGGRGDGIRLRLGFLRLCGGVRRFCLFGIAVLSRGIGTGILLAAGRQRTGH